MLQPPQKFLIIQTAFIGDVVLVTPVIEKLKRFFPGCIIDIVVRKGNESLLDNHPHLRRIIVFDKKKNKYINLFKLIREIRAERYEVVINAQRFFTTGLITVLSAGATTIGFDKNPLSPLFDVKVGHHIENGLHETERNLKLIDSLTDSSPEKPRLYPSPNDYSKTQKTQPYICIAPASVWFTKQFPAAKWMELIRQIPERYTIYLLGSASDQRLCEIIKEGSPQQQVEILAGRLTFLESAALMKYAVMNYVNDSAPLHFASAMNAPVTAVYCSTVPKFGFGPTSDISYIAEIDYDLYCRPCGLHGYKACPEKHFRCSEVRTDRMIVPEVVSATINDRGDPA